MSVRDAKALCPHLVILPYDFGAYEEVADQFYDILHKHCNKILVLSCDETYLDMTGSADPDCTGSAIRGEVFDVTKFTASAGIAGNLLMARMATKRAKPKGQYHIRPNEKITGNCQRCRGNVCSYIAIKVFKVKPLIEVDPEDLWRRIFPMPFVFCIKIQYCAGECEPALHTCFCHADN